MFQILILILLFGNVFCGCDHPIFCSEDILQAAADSNLFSDSMTFVDLPLKVPIQQALTNFKTQTPKEFIQSNFHLDPNVILVEAKFPDYSSSPDLLDRIQDGEIRKFAGELNRRWNLLGKRVDLSKLASVGTCKDNCTSFLPMVTNITMLVPGGRFRVSFYWDSYWIILGLIASDMLQTAEMLLDNFATSIETYGFIPNGFRTYFLNRSQPPYFFLMVKAVVEALRKKGFIQRASTLEKRMYKILNSEHKYWEDTHSLTAYIKGSTYTINQYKSFTTSPRPQSFKEDMKTAEKIVDPRERARLFNCLSAIAQSGWDFSSRWLQGQQLITTDIEKTIPSDLNALLGLMQKYLAGLSLSYGSRSIYEYYTDRYQERIKYFKAIKEANRFSDYKINQVSYQPRSVYPSDFLPFMLLEEKQSLSEIFSQVVNPQTSQLQTGQQWDGTDVWAPNNWILHEVAPSDEAKRYATQWVHTTYCSYLKYGALFEKYKSTVLGERGGGGQYESQIGFGWTNGLALHYLSLYPDITAPEC